MPAGTPWLVTLKKPHEHAAARTSATVSRRGRERSTAGMANAVVVGDRGDGEVGMRKIGGMVLTPDWTSPRTPARD